jgi:hypothetical protein
MKRNLCWLACVVLLIGARSGFAEAPRQIAGFTLGGNISQNQEMVKMDSVLLLRHMEYLSEVEIKPIEGYKSGYILFGNCDEPGRIVKIKMKYAIADRWFYDELLQRFRKKFGEPAQWKGDPFQTLIAWKWSFTDRHKNRISMILQHYTGDDDEYTRGNSIRLTMMGLIEKERLCYEKKHPDVAEPAKSAQATRKLVRKEDIDFTRFIPE